MVDAIDVEMCNFRNFGRSVTLTLDRVELILVRIPGRGLPTHQIRSKSKKLFSVRSSPGDDLIKIKTSRTYFLFAFDEELLP